jgi:biotin carboxylase
VIALSPRLSGGFFCTREIPLNTGVDFVGCAIRMALGESVSAEELEAGESKAVVQRYAFPKPGRIVSVNGAEDAKKIPGITDVVITARPGDVIAPMGDERPSVAMVLATGKSRETALTAVNDAIACLKIKTA